MIFAARKLQGFGLIMLVTFCFLIAYPISLRVSATRSELQRVEREIVAAQQRNRMIEGDIAVLANIQQLDRWNKEYLGYVAPGANQYLAGERALANLDQLRPARDGAPTAPVLMALGEDSGADAAADAPGIARQERKAPSAATRVAMAERTRLSDSAMRDIARTSTAGPALAMAGGAAR